MLVNKTITGLYNGVSQQPAVMRLENQCEEQINCMATLIDGLYPRYPTEFVAQLPINADVGDAFLVHTINRDSSERYIVVFMKDADTPIAVYDLEGNSKTVLYGTLSDDLTFTPDDSVKNYIKNTTSPQTDIKALTIADYTIVLNSQKVVAVDPAEVVETKQNIALVYSKIAPPEKTFNLVINGKTFSYTTPLSGGGCSTQAIINALTGAIASSSLGINVYNYGSTLLLWYDDNRDFTVKANDDYGNTALFVFKDEASSYSDLPPNSIGEILIQLNSDPYKFTQVGITAEYEVEAIGGGTPNLARPEYITIGATRYYTQGVIGSLGENEWAYDPAGKTVYLRVTGDVDPDTLTDAVCWGADKSRDFRIKVTHDESNMNVGYYLKYSNENWTETRGYNLHNKLDPRTMPHRLVRMSDGTFVFAPCVWNDRLVGDEDTAPTPNFVGQQINNIFFHRNRLGILARDGICLSKAAKFFDFFPKTALDVLDDDPIDIQVGSPEVVNLREALPFNKNLLIRADLGQYILHGGDVLTAKTVTISPTTHFETIPTSVSAMCGSNAYFACPNGRYLTIREYFVQPDSLQDDAADITVHIPKYIARGPGILTGCSALDTMFCWVPTDMRTLYVYKYYWVGNQKPQSAWCKWTFGLDIVGYGLFETSLYILFRKNNGTLVLERLHLDDTTNKQLGFKVRLDSITEVTPVFDPNTNKTSWTLPYYSKDYNDYVAVDTVTGLQVERITRTPGSDTVWTAEGDYSGTTHFIGRPYESLYTFSPWFMKVNKDNTITEGRLQVRYATIVFSHTGYFEVVVTPKHRNSTLISITSPHTGHVTIDEAGLAEGSRRVMVMSENTGYSMTLKSSLHYPFKIQGVTYEGSFVIRSKPL